MFKLGGPARPGHPNSDYKRKISYEEVTISQLPVAALSAVTQTCSFPVARFTYSELFLAACEGTPVPEYTCIAPIAV